MIVRRWGLEQVVNTNTANTQSQPEIAATPDGGFVVVWNDSDVTADGSAQSIKMQRFDAVGNKVGGEVLVNTTTFSTQHEPSVVVRDNGDIWVAWTDLSGAGGNGADIRYRRFDSDGNALDVNDRIAASLANNQSDPHLAIVSSGEVVLTFTSADASDNVFAQRFNQNNGNTSGGIINVANGGDDDVESSVATITGGFVTAWLDETTDRILVSKFNNTGGLTFGPIDVDNPANIDEGNADPQVVELANGWIVVAWTAGADTETDDVTSAIRGTILNADGDAIGAEFQVNTDPAGIQSLSSLTATADGGFLAVYRSNDEIRGQLFDAFGARVGMEFIVNSAVVSTQTDPDIAVLADGRIAVTWTDSSATGGDTSNTAVHVQIFDPRDGYIEGTNAADTLIGNDFLNDEMNGLAGADVLNGRAGADNMTGGEGDDTYVVDNTGDGVNEMLGAGTDTVLSTATFALSANVEHLTLIGAAKVNAIGNGLGNTLTGNGVANILTGGLGQDSLNGLGGADRYDFNNIFESAVGATRDTIVGFSRSQKDKVDLATIDADQRAGHAGNQVFVFIGTQSFAAHAGSGEVRRAGNVIQVNVDGDNLAEMEIQLGLAAIAGDFIL